MCANYISLQKTRVPHETPGQEDVDGRGDVWVDGDGRPGGEDAAEEGGGGVVGGDEGDEAAQGVAQDEDGEVAVALQGLAGPATVGENN